MSEKSISLINELIMKKYIHKLMIRYFVNKYSLFHSIDNKSLFQTCLNSMQEKNAMVGFPTPTPLHATKDHNSKNKIKIFFIEDFFVDLKTSSLTLIHL